jgi:hypothetical protein
MKNMKVHNVLHGWLHFYYNIRRITMKTLTIGLLVIMALLAVGCSHEQQATNDITVTGSGTLVSREITLNPFDTVEAGLHFDLRVRQGETYAVVVTSDDNFIDFIDVDQDETKISLGLRPEYAYNFYSTTLRAEVTMPEVAGLYLNGSSHAELDNLKDVENFTAELTGSSSLNGELETEKAALSVNGNAFVKLSGFGAQLWLDSCGNSQTDLSDFRAEEATVQASCASAVVVHATGSLDVEATQHARVSYSGEPKPVDIDVHEFASVVIGAD